MQTSVMLLGAAGAGAQIEPAHESGLLNGYVAPRAPRVTSTRAIIHHNGYTSYQVNVDAAGDNVVGDAANEPTLAVHPLDPNRLVIFWRQFDTVTSNFRQAGNAYSTDRGQNWTFPGVIEPSVFHSDPVLATTDDGEALYLSLNDLFDCTLFKSRDAGQTWDAGRPAWGGDKQWMTVDRTDGIGRGNVYAFWTDTSSVCEPGNFIRSTDGGETFEPCLEMPNTMWGTIDVGVNGEVYALGRGFVIQRFDNAQDPAATPTIALTRWFNMEGDLAGYGGPNPGGIMGQAWLGIDKSHGAGRGDLFALGSVQRWSGGDPLDVMFARSTNRGASWSFPVRVNDDAPGNDEYQWFGAMSVAPNGRIDVTYFSTEDNPGTYLSNLRYTYSGDGGATWAPQCRTLAIVRPTRRLAEPEQDRRLHPHALRQYRRRPRLRRHVQRRARRLLRPHSRALHRLRPRRVRPRRVHLRRPRLADCLRLWSQRQCQPDRLRLGHRAL